MRYRIRLINTETKETQITMMGFTNKKSAIEWAINWKSQGEPFDCDVLDTKKNFIKVF